MTSSTSRRFVTGAASASHNTAWFASICYLSEHNELIEVLVPGVIYPVSCTAVACKIILLCSLAQTLNLDHILGHRSPRWTSGFLRMLLLIALVRDMNHAVVRF